MPKNTNKVKLEKFLNLTESTTADVSQFPEMIKPLLYKVYTESLISEIADIQPLTSPVGKIQTLFSSYAGKSGTLDTFNSTIILLSVNTYVVDDEISTLTGTGIVEYSEGDKILVKILTGYFQVGQTVGTATIKDMITNRNYIRRAFKNYSGPYTTAEAETLTHIPEINHKLIQKTVEARSRKIKSKVTVEMQEDLKNQYGEEFAKDILENEFASEMVQAIDMEMIDYIKSIATPTSDVILANSYGTQGDLGALATDIYANTYKLTIDIMRNTKRHKNFFVLADAATMGLILSSPLHVRPQEDNENTYFMGKIGKTYDLYLDPYSTDNYVLVGYKNTMEGLGDSGLIYCPYNSTIWSKIDPESGQETFFHNMRYTFTTHPQDTTTGTSDSIFFKMFKVDLRNINNYVNVDNELLG